jgi:hypothetical protein
MKAMCKDPDQPLAARLVELAEADAILAQVDRQGRPLVALPVLVERVVGSPTPLEVVVLVATAQTCLVETYGRALRLRP